MSSVLPRIHLITPLVSTDLLRMLVGEGVDAIQVRDKSLSDADLLAFATAVVEAVQPLGARVIVNDRVDIALASGADGVHLGLTDLPIAVARALVPAGLLVGGTARSAADALAARAAGADYVGVGPVFASTTKADLPAPIGLSALADASSVLPSIAIAGITAERVPAVMAAGAYGVAVVAAISRAPDPRLAAKEIVTAVLAA